MFTVEGWRQFTALCGLAGLHVLAGYLVVLGIGPGSSVGAAAMTAVVLAVLVAGVVAIQRSTRWPLLPLLLVAHLVARLEFYWHLITPDPSRPADSFGGLGGPPELCVVAELLVAAFLFVSRKNVRQPRHRTAIGAIAIVGLLAALATIGATWIDTGTP
ncbi:MAG: hypothetical protein ACR2QO_21390 [Acidimicrobiales bacterium]